MAVPGAVPAGVGKRVLACVIDGLAAFLLGGAFVVAGAWEAAASGGPASGGSGVGMLVGGGVALAVVGVVQWLCHGLRGVTLGKALVGLRTVDADTGRPIGLGRALLRYLFVGVVGAIPVLGWVVLLSPLFDRERRQGWHDKAVRALVVDAALGTDPVRAAATAQARLDGLLAPVAATDVPPVPVPPVGAPVPPPAPAAPVPPPAPAAGPLPGAAPEADLPEVPAAPTPAAQAPAAPPFGAPPVPDLAPEAAMPEVLGAPVAPAPAAAPPFPAPSAPAPVAAPLPATAPVPDVAPPPAAPPAPVPAVPAAAAPLPGGLPPLPDAAPVGVDPMAPIPAAVPPAPDAPPRAFPAPPAPAAPVREPDTATTGIISAVPGAPAPQAPARPPLEPTVLVDHVPDALRTTGVPGGPAEEDAEDVEATRLSLVRRPGGRRRTDGPPRAVLKLWDGNEVVLTGIALVGRNPARRDDEPLPEHLVVVPDQRRSVSKTHLAVGVDANGTWVRDRGSTNGTVVTLADGQQIICASGQEVRVPEGATVSFGDYWFTVG